MVEDSSIFEIPIERVKIYKSLAERLEEVFRDIKKKYQTSSVGVAYSGGLDSSVVGFLALKYLDPCFYVVGFEGSRDIINSKTGLEHLSEVLGTYSRLKLFTITDEHVFEALRFFSNLGIRDVLLASFEIPLYFVLKNSKEKILISGQGADELFGGYAKYLVNPHTMDEDFKKLVEYTLPIEDKIAEYFGKIIVRPYLDEEIVQLAKDLPIEEKVYKGIRKLALRRIAKYLGLPKEIFLREKKAAQYGSGVMKSIRRISRKLHVEVRDILKVLADESEGLRRVENIRKDN